MPRDATLGAAADDQEPERTAGEPAGGAADRAADRAAATLEDLRTIAGRSRWAASRGLTRVPLLSWGLAWAVGYPLLDHAPWTTAVLVGTVLALGALVATWFCRSPQVRTGWERRGRASWLVLMLSSPLLVGVITPLPGRRVALFLGALWGVALVLLAVATGDRPLGVVGALIALAATGCQVLDPAHALTPFGLISGGAMIVLGGWRTWSSR